MSDTGKTAPAAISGLLELGTAIVTGTTRLGLTIISIPLSVLPVATRRRFRRAVAELARALVVLPKELSEISEKVVDDIFEGPAPTLPSPQAIGDRARAFTERVARAADELGATFNRTAARAVDDVQRTAAKVDEWVEKAPKA